MHARVFSEVAGTGTLRAINVCQDRMQTIPVEVEMDLAAEDLLALEVF